MAARANILGNLVRDAEVRDLGGQKACVFSVAVRTPIKDREGNYVSNFYECTLWGKRGETFGAAAKKGNRVSVWGSFAMTDYVTKEGEKRSSLRMTADDAELLERSAAAAQAAPAASASRHKAADDDIPF